MLRARKNLKGVTDQQYGNIFINESMCDPYKKLDYVCRRLKKNGNVHSTWFFNGRLYFKKSENGDKIQRHLYGEMAKKVKEPSLREAMKKYEIR